MKKNKQEDQPLYQTPSVLTDVRVIKNPTHAIAEPVTFCCLYLVGL